MIDYTKSFTAEATRQASYDEGLKAYVLKVYNYMTMALLVTGGMAFATLNFPLLTQLMFNVTPSGQIMGFSGLGSLIAFAPLIMSMVFFFGFASMRAETAQIIFWSYAALMGMSLSSLGLIYTGTSIVRTFLICSGLFGAMSIYGHTTKRDLTAFGSFLIMGLLGLIVASLVNLFFKSPAIEFATSIIGVGIFTGLIAWDTQKIKSMYYQSGGGEQAQKLSILAALTLYLDFINLFIYLLRFFGNRRD